MNSKLFSEIVEDFQKETTKNGRIDSLRRNFNPRFVDFLRVFFDKNVKFDVEIPEYKPSNDPAGLNVAYLHNEIKKLYLFTVGHPQRPITLTAKKQKELLIQILESLHKDEAQMLVGLLSGKLKMPYLTVKLVNEAYDTRIPE